MILIIVVAVVAAVMVVGFGRTVRIVPQARAYVVERLGSCSRTLDAGLNSVEPFIDQIRARVDLREQVVSFAPQPVITEDNLVVHVDTVLYFQVTDPRAAMVAQGQAEAIGTVFEAIHRGRPDPQLLAYQYLQTLPKLANGDGNHTWLIPSELTRALDAFASGFGDRRTEQTSTPGPVASGEAARAPQMPPVVIPARAAADGAAARASFGAGKRPARSTSNETTPGAPASSPIRPRG
jgi:regulator of protease activity HflC (stomatin/prohibitin superfamily)